MTGVGRRPARRRPWLKTIDGVKTLEEQRFRNVDGAPLAVLSEAVLLLNDL